MHFKPWVHIEFISFLILSALTEKINSALQSSDVGRLFAVIHIAGKQRKVTTEDIILIQHYFAPNVGDRIRLEKVNMLT